MRLFGRASVSEFLGDFVVYRNLVPADERLSPLDAIRAEIGLPAGRLPRKSEPDYARVIVQLINQARNLDASGHEIQRLLYVGDTRLNDGTAFANVCAAGEWRGLAFIAAETDASENVQVVRLPPQRQSANESELVLANRWSALYQFDALCAERDFAIDASTAVIVDLDKTALGARGRNAQAIDQARVDAVQITVADLLGDAFDAGAFRTAYDALNQPEYHPFTADNQDYLAYVCLILGSGLFNLEEIIAEIGAGQLETFEQFITLVDQKSAALESNLAAMHTDILSNVRSGDPTPFKSFRFNEYETTVSRMGQLDDTASVDEMLQREIVITQEVRSQALKWRERGALLFGLSDKPDEASIPSQALAAKGYQPIHRTVTHAVGG
jgi:hypothetical protein